MKVALKWNTWLRGTHYYFDGRFYILTLFLYRFIEKRLKNYFKTNKIGITTKGNLKKHVPLCMLFVSF